MTQAKPHTSNCQIKYSHARTVVIGEGIVACRRCLTFDLTLLQVCGCRVQMHRPRKLCWYMHQSCGLRFSFLNDLSIDLAAERASSGLCTSASGMQSMVGIATRGIEQPCQQTISFATLGISGSGGNLQAGAPHRSMHCSGVGPGPWKAWDSQPNTTQGAYKTSNMRKVCQGGVVA